MAPAAAIADPLDIERAWYLLTVVVRLGRPAAVSDLAAIAAISPRIVERMCRIPESPLCLSDGGVVTASQTAVMANLRFVGWDVPAPKVSLWPPDVRRWWGEMTLTYARKRKASDAGRSGGKRLRLLAPDADLVEHQQLKSLEMTTQNYAPVANGEVHMGLTLELQNWLPTCHSFVGEPSIEISTGLTVIPNVSEIGIAYAHPRIDQSPRGDNGTIIEKEALALVPTELSVSPFGIYLPSLDAEKPRNIHAATNNKYRTGESDDVRFNNHKQDDSPNAGYYENTPTLNQEKNPLDAIACVEIHKNKETQILLHPPTDDKEESQLPEMKRNIKPASFPQEATCYDRDSQRNLNSSAENRESLNLNNGEKSRNEATVTVANNGQDRKIVKQREKSKKIDGLPKDAKDQHAAKAQTGNVAPKPLPSFEGFLIEEEEGSGGYGTVYRARRQVDGKIFAIKCPHLNAHPHHVNNELKMLERFGGKYNVIKYDSSFQSGDLQCFVLEHVEHDRPEILRKEIDILQLQWYGYCLFRALTCLHKQGIVHRDVKPGNFLFSRKMMKGYLIDFNLANDLNQKFLQNCKSEKISCGKDKTSHSSSRLAPIIHAKEAIADVKQPLPSKRKKPDTSRVGSTSKIDNKSRHGSHAADASGVTSAKDPTSTKTSLDRLKQPMLYKGRKELMNFLHETMQSPNKDTSKAPVSQRKRVAAPFGSVGKKLFVLTPMPLRSDGSSVAGSGMLNNKGHGKNRREGPCVGTKGFRAPEVLFKSFHQGCKVDVWSAGVTLLYFIIGRTPFGGDPEQNIKEIAKLKGSEELWEVAKLHNRESSYPSDLFEVELLRTLDLREWCAANTRRPEFLKMIPDSLFDLVDKCLAVNPRCRLTSEDALMHEFFAPVRDSLRKQRVPRRSTGADIACSSQANSLVVKLS